MQNIVEALNWRYAVKAFDPNKKISDQQLNTLLESLRLSPSSFGLQPWKFIVVKNPEVRAKLREVSWGQSQITDASHLIVFAVETKIDDEFIDQYLKSIVETRGVPLEALNEYATMMKGFVNARTPEDRLKWATNQAYLAMGVLMAAAATEQIDTTPMEGFDPKAYDEILGLTEKGLAAKIVAAVGYRSADDMFAGFKKVRYPQSEVVMVVE